MPHHLSATRFLQLPNTMVWKQIISTSPWIHPLRSSSPAQNVMRNTDTSLSPTKISKKTPTDPSSSQTITSTTWIKPTKRGLKSSHLSPSRGQLHRKASSWTIRKNGTTSQSSYYSSTMRISLVESTMSSIMVKICLVQRHWIHYPR